MELNPVSTNVVGCTTIAFDLGKTATKFYFDNAKVEIWNANTGSSTPRTDAEKKTIIDAALKSWISTIVTPCKNYVKAWDVVNEPISDTDPTLLKTGVGRTLPSGEFYWQDYLGKDYAINAITYARQYGNASDKLFVSDYGLEAIDQLKCQGLITYINYLEGKGVKLDGIGAELHVTLGITSLDAIKAMFTTLANTGKLIKVSQLDMGINPAGTGANLLTTVVTFSQLKQMSDFYNQIVKAYIQLVPAAQRYGITQWALSDGQTGAGWRAGQPIGLWSSAANPSWITASPYTRKPAYAGFANALQGK
jgi:GH35 family endo-1,4-beta-xylanase